TKIRNPNITDDSTQEQAISYIKDSYQAFYKSEDINKEAALQITTSEQNLSLTRPITEKEISLVINKLPNNKAPDSDGLIYEFYKDTKELILPIFVKVFNNMMNTGTIPSS
ncbi:2745_t:CDS:1, partial [Racocetra fulgida]